MQTRILLSALGLLCVAGLALKVHANYPTQGRTVKLSVAATDASPGSTLHYQWRSTDGTLISVDAPSATWTLPAGPGLHFAYVLVSNGLGGYTEKRIAVNTDTFGSYIPSTTPRAYVAPPASAPTGDTYRSWVDWNQTYVDGFNHDVQVPDASVYLVDNNTGTTYPPSGSVKTDLRGQYVIPNVLPETVTTRFVSCLELRPSLSAREASSFSMACPCPMSPRQTTWAAIPALTTTMAP